MFTFSFQVHSAALGVGRKYSEGQRLGSSSLCLTQIPKYTPTAMAAAVAASPVSGDEPDGSPAQAPCLRGTPEGMALPS